MKTNIIKSRLTDFKPRTIFEKYIEKKELDESVINKVYENQNGRCSVCPKGIHAIVKVRNQMSDEVGYIGLCEPHSHSAMGSKKVIGIQA